MAGPLAGTSQVGVRPAAKTQSRPATKAPHSRRPPEAEGHARGDGREADDFDRNEEARGLLGRMLEGRREGEPVLDLLQRAVHQLVREGHVFVKFNRSVSTFWRTVEASEALQAYVREMRSDSDAALAEALAAESGARTVDASARLLAGILVTGWLMAYGEALRRQRAGESAEAARRAFLALVDRGFDAARTVAAGTPYAEAPGARRRGK